MSGTRHDPMRPRSPLPSVRVVRGLSGLALLLAGILIAGCHSGDEDSTTAAPSTPTKPAATAEGTGGGTVANTTPQPGTGNAPTGGGTESTSSASGTGVGAAATGGADHSAAPRTSTGAQDVSADTGGSTDGGYAQATGKRSDGSPVDLNTGPKPDKDGNYTSGPTGDPLQNTTAGKP